MQEFVLCRNYKRNKKIEYEKERSSYLIKGR
jgi:hypothetical protein